MRLTVGILLSLASSAALNWGFFVQHDASGSLPALCLRSPFRSLRILFGNLRWVVGYAVGVGGWGLYIVALWFAPLSIVQAISAGGVGILALFAVGKKVMSSRETWALSASLGGVVLVLVSLAGSSPHEHAANLGTLLLSLGALTVVSAVLCKPASGFVRPGAGLGAAAGLLYAAGDMSTKGAIVGDGLYLVGILIAFHVLGFVTLQLAFQRGSALATAGLSTLLNNSVPIIAGVVLFHEGLPQGVWGPFRLAGFILVVTGATMFARKEPPRVREDSDLVENGCSLVASG